jgi:hypothetical protein
MIISHQIHIPRPDSVAGFEFSILHYLYLLSEVAGFGEGVCYLAEQRNTDYLIKI